MPKAKMAMLYDFDKTLCTRDMQEFTFIPGVGMEPEEFWKLSNSLSKDQKMDKILACMYMMIRKSNAAFKAIRREDFVKLGDNIEFFPGVREWFSRITEYAATYDLDVEHYVISSGLKEIIEGCEIADRFRSIYACEFHYDVNGVADWPRQLVNYTTKTQFLFRINKGLLDVSNDKDLNDYTSFDARPIPFTRMVYIGDGFTDVPCMKLVKEKGGKSIAVFSDDTHRSIAEDLMRDDRVNFIAKADYSEGSELDAIVRTVLDNMGVELKLRRMYKRQLESIPDAVKSQDK